MSQFNTARFRFFIIYCNPVNGGAGTIYYDDLVLIPYARVHFNAGGGSGAPEDMFLLSGNVEIPDTVPVRRGFEFGGWSLTDGGSAPVTSVTVGGSDVELYAIIGHTSERLLDRNDGQPCQSVKRYYRKQSCAYGNCRRPCK